MLDRIDQALQQVEPDWGPARAARGWQRLGSALHRRRRRSAALAFVAAAGVAGAVAIWVGQGALSPSASTAEAQLTFLDGTAVRATLPATELRVAEDTPARRVVQIVRGGARFDVAPVAGRTFRVQLRHVAVDVLGTVFRVEEAGERVRVAVERGRVRVQQGAERRELGPGQSLELSPPAIAPSPPSPAPVASTIPLPPASGAPPALSPRNRTSPEGLLAAADRARRAGRPHLAMRQLRALVARFPDDDRAPLAAFTLGLVALERRRPEEAAQAFALSRRLAPAGELAEDALAREVQSWYEAGEAHAAQDRASEYQRLYPAGRRLGSVRRLGGLR